MATNQPSPFGGADEQVATYPSSQSPLLRTEKVGVLLFQNYKHLPANGAKSLYAKESLSGSFTQFATLSCPNGVQ